MDKYFVTLVFETVISPWRDSLISSRHGGTKASAKAEQALSLPIFYKKSEGSFEIG
jgi:hypothetical protein